MTPPNPQAQINRLREALDPLKGKSSFFPGNLNDHQLVDIGTTLGTLRKIDAALADVPAEAVETRKEWRVHDYEDHEYGCSVACDSREHAESVLEAWTANGKTSRIESRTPATPWTREKEPKEC